MTQQMLVLPLFNVLFPIVFVPLFFFSSFSFYNENISFDLIVSKSPGTGWGNRLSQILGGGGGGSNI